jgi:hypothetical protein
MDIKKLGLGLGAFAAGAAAWVIGTRAAAGKPARPSARPREPDAIPALADRAPEKFRPDPTAIPTPEEREALRPATGPAPSFAADRGSSI